MGELIKGNFGDKSTQALDVFAIEDAPRETLIDAAACLMTESHKLSLQLDQPLTDIEHIRGMITAQLSDIELMSAHNLAAEFLRDEIRIV